MAFNPYFRYETTSLDFLSGVFSPSFPAPHGLSLHSYATEKPTYTITNRLHGTTQINWTSESVKPTDKDTIFAFWNETLSEGLYSFTIIDNRGRMLFESQWDVWNQRWVKQRGGVNNIDYNIQASNPWTLPTHGMYLMSDDTLDNHNLQGNNLTATDATLVNNALDANVLRLNGSALKITGEAGLQTGATGTVNFSRSTKENSVALFCQARITSLMSVGRVYFIELTGGGNIYRLAVEAPRYVIGILGTPASPVIVRKGFGENFIMQLDTWYDLCFTYDAITGQNYLYFTASGDSIFVDFLTGAEEFDEQVGTYGSISFNQSNWSTVNLLAESLTGAIATEESMYLQNAMIFDGYMTSFDFNTIRRLCWLWNKKTTGTWPK